MTIIQIKTEPRLSDDSLAYVQENTRPYATLRLSDDNQYKIDDCIISLGKYLKEAFTDNHKQKLSQEIRYLEFLKADKVSLIQFSV